MAANFNNNDLTDLPKSNESNIIAHHCSQCGHKDYIMVTSVNLNVNHIESRKHNFNISNDENAFESPDEEMVVTHKVTNTSSGNDLQENREFVNQNQSINRKSERFDERLSQSPSPLMETQVIKPFPVIKRVPFNESQFKNDLKSLIRIPPNSQDGNTIGKYYVNSQKVVNASKTDKNNTRTEITNVFSAHKKGREPNIDKRFLSDRRLLLWFGIKKELLAEMLNIRQLDIPLIRGKFGNGFYFSDRVSESIKHCDQNNGFLLLCEVAVGSMYRIGKTKNFSSPPNGFDSIKVVGKYTADKQMTEKYNKDVIVPIGKTIKNPSVTQSEFDFNKYVVFDQNRFQIRFIVEFETE